MRYLSVCSGIEAASVAWHHLGWEPVGFSEIEPFPAAVLAHRFPNIPNYGDMTKHESWPITRGAIDLLVGGTPCQSFSVAGLRQGLADPRGNLMLTYLAIADRLRPRWLVWENVPGVLSSNGGRDFGTFLGALGNLGYGWAYRCLDAQYLRVGRWPRAVPQRRRRVFVVGCLGDWAAPGEVLALDEGLQRHLEARRAKGKGVAADAEGGVGGGCWWDGSDCAGTLTKQNANGAQRMPDKDNFGAVLQPTAYRWQNDRDGLQQDDAVAALRASQGASGFHEMNHPVIAQPVAFTQNCREEVRDLGDASSALTGQGTHQQTYIAQPVPFRDVSPTLTSRMQGSSGWAPVNEDAHLVGQPVPFTKAKRAQSTTDDETWVDGQVNPTLSLFDQGDTRATTVAVAFQQNQLGEVRCNTVAGTVNTNSNPSGRNTPMVAIGTDCYNGAITGDVAATMGTPGSSVNASGPTIMQAVAFTVDMQACKGNANVGDGSVSPTLCKPSGNDVHAVAHAFYSTGGTHGVNQHPEVSPAVNVGSGLGIPSPPAVAVAPSLTATNDPSRSPQSSEVTQQVAAVHASTMTVRRLSPMECERLQGFPLSWQIVTIEACFDHHQGHVHAVVSCRSALGNASPAVEKERWQHVPTAPSNSLTSQAKHESLAALSVLTNYEAELLEIRSLGKLLWYANGAARPNSYRLSMPAASIARELAQHAQELVQTIQDGKAGSRLSMTLSIPAKSGNKPVKRCGDAILENVADVLSDHAPDTFTTSDLGQLRPTSDSASTTSCCSVFHAIAGCIPSAIIPNSFSVEIAVGTPWTLIPWRGKPAEQCPDGPRYKALGNSMACNCMAWIGERIAAYEAQNGST